MTKKLEYIDIKSVLDDAALAIWAKDGSYTRWSGYLEAMTTSLVLDLPAHKQAEFIQTVKQSKEIFTA